MKGEIFRDATLHKSVTKGLQYATITKPELAFDVNKLSQFMSNPLVPYWTAYKRVLKYLKSIINYKFEFSSLDNNNITCYCDVDQG